LEDSSISATNRYLSVAVYQEKMFFNTIVLFYIPYCQLVGEMPDISFMERAQAMDRILLIEEEVDMGSVFRKLAHASEVIASMTAMTMQALDKVSSGN
jgi:hypothetical protein